MRSQKLVIPVKTGIQGEREGLKILDSHLRENDGKRVLSKKDRQ